MRTSSRKFWSVLYFVFALAILNCRAGTSVFSNTNYLTINDSDNPPTIAFPYPSTISVSNLTGQVLTNLTVTLTGLSHDYPSDIDMILVGPHGQWTYLMAEVGGIDFQFPVTNVTITLNDAGDPLPVRDPLFSGIFRPTLNPFYQPFDFPFPAPSVGTNLTAALSVFKNTDPNGIWSLYVVDDTSENAGSISGGWSLNIFTGGVPLQVVQSGANAVFSWPAVTGRTFSLEYSPSLGNSASWTNISATPVLNTASNSYFLTNHAFGYYRLIGQ